jgi:hypothetical protein
MDEVWELGQIHDAWEQIHRALRKTLKPLPDWTLMYLAARASDAIVREHAAEVLDWRANRDRLPDWGWAVCRDKKRPRGPASADRA